jgi:hypothetical protein
VPVEPVEPPPGQPVHVHETRPLMVLKPWLLHDDGHRSFEQQPLEPRSADVEHWAYVVVTIASTRSRTTTVCAAVVICGQSD